jgi:uncharacterized membrane protein YpjA
MGVTAPLGSRLDALVARYFDAPIPETRDLGWYVSPLPEWVENVGLRLAWPIALVNLVGTFFGFVYYAPQFAATPVVMWPIVPVSPLATLYMSLSLALWRLEYSGRLAQLVHVLAFIGCLKYGLWTVYVQVFIEGSGVLPLSVWLEGPGYIPLWLWHFLIWSHAAMAVQAFLIHRYADFRLAAVAGAVGWFTLNDVFDYFVTILGGPHHTWLNALPQTGVERTLTSYGSVAGAAVVLTILGTVLALATRIELLTARGRA